MNRTAWQEETVVKVENDLVDEITDSKAIRRVFGAFATGVTVVSVGGDTPHAMTANAFSTVSLDPPLVLVCVGRSALMHAVLDGCAGFGVSVLSAGQEAVARYYADSRRPLGPEQFDFTGWEAGERTGVPLLAGAVAQLECLPFSSYDGGDHSIFLGRPVAMRRVVQDDPLVFLSGRFRAVAGAQP